MNKSIKNAIFLSVGLLATTTSFGQKMMETSASSEYENKFVKALEKRDYTTASESILKAKEFIDQASSNEETKSSAKTQYYKGVIYLGLVELTKATTKDEAKIKEYQLIANENLVLAFNNQNTKYKDKVQDYVNGKAIQVFNSGAAAFEAKNFEAAMFLFIESNTIKKILGQKMENADANAEVSFLKAVYALTDAKKYDDAMQLAESFKTYYPTNQKVLRTILDIYYLQEKLVEYEKNIDSYATTYPSDTLIKKYYYNLATLNLGKKEFEKAESNYKKALTYDGMYIDAIYQLASTYISWSMDLSKQASALQLKDPKMKVLDDQSNKILLKGINALEKYTSVETTDKAALTTLYRAYSRIGNEAKATETKAKADAIK